MSLSKKEIEALEQELGIPKIPQIDLGPFLREIQRDPKKKMGLLKQNIDSLISFKVGELVLFTPCTVEDCYGKMEWDEMKHRLKFCTIETFTSAGTGTITKTMAGVPLDYILYEIKI